MGFDLESFAWGMVVGSIGTVVVGGVIFYLTLPLTAPVLVPMITEFAREVEELL